MDGLENSSVVGISTKGHISKRNEYLILCETIKYLVKNKPNLKALVVYDVCGDHCKTEEAFKCAIDSGVKVIISNNSLRCQNMKRWSINNETQ